MTGVRVASTPDDLDEIVRLRYDVYLREMGKEVPGADHTRGRLQDDLDADAINLLLKDKHGIAGTARFNMSRLPEEYAGPLHVPRFENVVGNRFAYVSKLIVTPGKRGSLACGKLMRALYVESRIRGAQIALCHCSPNLVPLYERAGWLRHAAPFQSRISGLQMPLVMLLEHSEYLQKIGSILGGVSREFENTSQLVDWFHHEYQKISKFYFGSDLPLRQERKQ